MWDKDWEQLLKASPMGSLALSSRRYSLNLIWSARLCCCVSVAAIATATALREVARAFLRVAATSPTNGLRTARVFPSAIQRSAEKRTSPRLTTSLRGNGCAAPGSVEAVSSLLLLEAVTSVLAAAARVCASGLVSMP